MLETHCFSVTGCQSCSWAGLAAGLEEPPEEDEEELPLPEELEDEPALEEPELDPVLPDALFPVDPLPPFAAVAPAFPLEPASP